MSVAPLTSIGEDIEPLFSTVDKRSTNVEKNIENVSNTFVLMGNFPRASLSLVN